MRKMIKCACAALLVTTVLNTSFTSKCDYSIPKEIYPAYYQYNWSEDPAVYEPMNQLLADAICTRLVVPRLTVMYYNGDPDVNHSYYKPGSDCIFINREIMYSAQYAFKAIAHEVRHAYQWKHSQNPETETDQAYKYGYENYIRSKVDYDAYANQYIELDAEDYANRLYLELINSASDVPK